MSVRGRRRLRLYQLLLAVAVVALLCAVCRTRAGFVSASLVACTALWIVLAETPTRRLVAAAERLDRWFNRFDKPAATVLRSGLVLLLSVVILALWIVSFWVIVVIGVSLAWRLSP